MKKLIEKIKNVFDNKTKDEYYKLKKAALADSNMELAAKYRQKELAKMTKEERLESTNQNWFDKTLYQKYKDGHSISTLSIESGIPKKVIWDAVRRFDSKIKKQF
jgi:hypothetical protein